MNRLLATALSLSLHVAPAMAGPVEDFESVYDTAYAQYRTALFATNAGNAERSVAVLGQLDSAWSALMAQYRASPPPQYEADPMWDETIEEVTTILDAATTQVAAGDLAMAHVTLEGVREALGALHARNNIETFSDRMNAYHAEMEAILEMDLDLVDATARQRLLEHSAVLAYLARDVLSAPPAVARDNAEYAPLAAAMQASVDQFVAAARAGDDAALRTAVGGLKVPYSRLFLQFG